VRRPLVSGPGEQLGEQDRVDDLARRLGVRAPARLGPKGDQEKGTEVIRHLHILAGGEDGRGRD
jgi:hypothetical protein